MKTIYVITQCWTDYDDSGSFPILATFDNRTAHDKISQMNERLAARNLTYESINKYMAEWEITNPKPRHQIVKEKSLPDYGRSRNKWSKEQLAEYKAIQKANEDHRINAVKPLYNWSQERYAEQKRFTESLPQQEKDDLNNLRDDLYWEIEEVPFEE